MVPYSGGLYPLPWGMGIPGGSIRLNGMVRSTGSAINSSAIRFRASRIIESISYETGRKF